jgi:hypothetical protein
MLKNLPKKSLQRMVIFTLLIIAISVSLACGYIYITKNHKKEAVPGTKISYKEGKVERFKQKFDYTNTLFPDLFIPLKDQEFDISQIDRTEGKKLIIQLSLANLHQILLFHSIQTIDLLTLV